MKFELVEVYEYHELPDDVKKTVLDRERELMSYDSCWIYDLKYLFDDMLADKGIKAYPTEDLEFAISLSYCQGDGVGFFGNLDTEHLFTIIPDVIKTHFPILVELIAEYNKTDPNYITILNDEISVNIGKTNSFSSIAMQVDVDIPDINDMIYTTHLPEDTEYVIEQERKDFEAYLKDWFDDIASELERIGYADLEARESEDNIVENLDGNDIRFLKNGYMIDWAIMSEDDLKHT